MSNFKETHKISGWVRDYYDANGNVIETREMIRKLVQGEIVKPEPTPEPVTEIKTNSAFGVNTVWWSPQLVGKSFGSMRYYTGLFYFQNIADSAMETISAEDKKSGASDIGWVIQGNIDSTTDRKKPATGSTVLESSYVTYANNIVEKVLPRCKDVNWLQIWNEPDGSWKEAGRFTGEEYAAMLAASYKAIKKAKPEMKVVSAGISKMDYEFLGGMKKWFDANGYKDKYPLDAFCFHTYNYTGEGASRKAVSPYEAGYFTNVKNFVTAVKTAFGCEVWLTETGYGVDDYMKVSEPQRSAWSVQSMLLAYAAGVSKIHYYSYPMMGVAGQWDFYLGLIDNTKVGDKAHILGLDFNETGKALYELSALMKSTETVFNENLVICNLGEVSCYFALYGEREITVDGVSRVIGEQPVYVPNSVRVEIKEFAGKFVSTAKINFGSTVTGWTNVPNSTTNEVVDGDLRVAVAGFNTGTPSVSMGHNVQKDEFPGVVSRTSVTADWTFNPATVTLFGLENGNYEVKALSTNQWNVCRSRISVDGNTWVDNDSAANTSVPMKINTSITDNKLVVYFTYQPGHRSTGVSHLNGLTIKKI